MSIWSWLFGKPQADPQPEPKKSPDEERGWRIIWVRKHWADHSGSEKSEEWYEIQTLFESHYAENGKWLTMKGKYETLEKAKDVAAYNYGAVVSRKVVSP